MLKLNLTLSELLRNKFVATMCQPIRLKSIIKSMKSIKPIVDSFISEMTNRFHTFNCKVAKLLILTPSVLWSETFRENVYIYPILEGYEEHSINRDVVDQELPLWQCKWLVVASKGSVKYIDKGK